VEKDLARHSAHEPPPSEPAPQDKEPGK
jgi:hypothetical protein